jgi:hypothetical protein
MSVYHRIYISIAVVLLLLSNLFWFVLHRADMKWVGLADAMVRTMPAHEVYFVGTRGENLQVYCLQSDTLTIDKQYPRAVILSCKDNF